MRWRPAYDLEPERSYGGRLDRRPRPGPADARARLPRAVDRRRAGGGTAGRAARPAGPWKRRGATPRSSCRAARCGARCYLHRDWPVRLVLETSHGRRADGWSGRL
ncbi:MAG: hypothetical protein M0C28_11300 [Candidatus Moduliflexus flocculans]|nr:hypothetical protein [Candidatus Moduliflexus flocculans]